MSLYTQRGVSAQKEDVHKATAMLDPGLYPYAFCKIYPDYLGGDPDWVNLMHADGAGTKSILAYLYWKETGDLNVWKGIAHDAVAMNLDDLLCVGIFDNLIFSSTIDRNKLKIPGAILESIIGGTQEFFEELKIFGIAIKYLGGETADIGDVVRTIAVNGTMTARWKKDGIITNERIQPGDIIVGLASDGRASYESGYNSGIGSNGLTSARHDLLHQSYAGRFPESYDDSLGSEVAYIGSHHLTDMVTIRHANQSWTVDVGHLLLSPTRTYGPLIKRMLEENFPDIHGLVHCSGGGQTKCLKYLPGQYKVVKDNLFDPPEIFRMIQSSSQADDREMYQVFNMGHRMEIFVHPKTAEKICSMAKYFHIEAKVVGHVEASDKKELLLKSFRGQTLHFADSL